MTVPSVQMRTIPTESCLCCVGFGAYVQFVTRNADSLATPLRRRRRFAFSDVGPSVALPSTHTHFQWLCCKGHPSPTEEQEDVTMKLTSALSLWMAAPSVSAFATVPQHANAAFVRTTPVLRMGIMDEINSDSFDLLSSNKGGDLSNAAYEQFLADLVFSTNDPRVDIINNFDRCVDEEWLAWLDKKVESSRDPEERIALRDLYEMILDVKSKMELSQMAEERAQKEREEIEAARMAAADAEANEGRKLSNADVLRRATAINTAQAGMDVAPKEEKKSFYDQEITPEIRMSYEKLLKQVLPPYKSGDNPSTIVFNYYDQFDAQFVKVLTERSIQGDEDANALLSALAVEQQKKISVATETLKSVLALGDPMRMEGAIVKLAREGKVDEPFLLLLEANATQARDAGALGPAQLMDKLRKRAAEEKDKQMSSKEIRLIRQLLRSDDSAEREKILESAFTPRENLLVSYQGVQ